MFQDIKLSDYLTNNMVMKYCVLITLALLITEISIAQNKDRQIEISPYFRQDSYKEFLATSFTLGDNYVTPKGSSYGININLKEPINKNFKMIIGFGYYRNTINKIKRRNTSYPGQADDRQINFPTPLFIPFFTDKYWYHSIAVNVGVARVFNLHHDFVFSLDATVNNFFTFSQYYHLTSNPAGSVDFKKNEFKYSGLSAILQAGLQKRLKRISIGPSILIPVYTNWKTDKTLPDLSSKGSRDKWFAAIGFGFSLNYSLSSKNKNEK